MEQILDIEVILDSGVRGTAFFVAEIKVEFDNINDLRS